MVERICYEASVFMNKRKNIIQEAALSSEYHLPNSNLTVEGQRMTIDSAMQINDRISDTFRPMNEYDFDNMSPAEIQALAPEGWKIIKSKDWSEAEGTGHYELRKKWIFDKDDGWDIVRGRLKEIIATISKSDHHPEVKFDYNSVEVTLWSHDANGITEKDTTMAVQLNQQMDNLATEIRRNIRKKPRLSQHDGGKGFEWFPVARNNAAPGATMEGVITANTCAMCDMPYHRSIKENTATGLPTDFALKSTIQNMSVCLITAKDITSMFTLGITI